MQKSNIVLIGFMGTGKTTTGKIMSNILGYPFIDIDEIIEKRYSLAINEIFRLKGEKYFREIESKIVSEVSKNKGTIIACGGGVVKKSINIDNLRINGIVICLKADSEVIYKRLSINNEIRPLASDKSKEEILKLITEREELYNRADIFVDTSNESPFYIAKKILISLNFWKMD